MTVNFAIDQRNHGCKIVIQKYSAQNEGKSIAAERYIKNLKKKIYSYMTPISKNRYVDILDDKVTEYKNVYRRKIKMKPVDVH